MDAFLPKQIDNALSNGIICSSNPVETAYETELRDEMLNDKKEWEDIMKEAGEDTFGVVR